METRSLVLGMALLGSALVGSSATADPTPPASVAAEPAPTDAQTPAQPASVAPSSSTAPSPPPPPAPVHAAPEPKPVWPTAVLAGVGVVGLAIGIGLNVDASEQLILQNRDGRSLLDVVAAYNRLSAGGLASFIIGGASLAGMVVYVIWPGPTAEKPHTAPPPVVALPWANRGGAGLVVTGRF